MKTYAVLTGDIIGSSRLGTSGLSDALTRLRGLAGEFEQVHPSSILGQPDVFRGDSWQLCLERPSLVLTAAVFIRAGLKASGYDTRIGIGWGPVDHLNEDRISESGGPAFVLSGLALDRMGKDRVIALFPSDEGAHSGISSSASAILDASLALLDALINGWTQRESVAVYGVMRKLSQEEIAALPLALTRQGRVPTRQAIQDALRRVSWTRHVGPFLETVETTIGGNSSSCEGDIAPAGKL